MPTESSSIQINGVDLPVKEYRGQPVVTLKEIDAVHKRPEGTAKRAFIKHKARLIEGEDYFLVTASQKDVLCTLEIPNRGLTLLTESGYLMLVKSFTDDLAWAVQRQLVNVYFRATPEQKQEAAQKTFSDLELMAQGLFAAQRVVEAQEQKIKSLEQKAEENAPLVSFAEDIGLSNGSVSIGDFAKLLYEQKHIETGQKRLFKLLRDGQILDARNMPYQKYMESGWFEVIEIYNRHTGYTHRQPRLTGKGQRKIYERFFLPAQT